MSVDSIGVIGAGLVGLAVGRRLVQLGHDVTILEKEDDVAVHQSGHNSGVVHSGIYYPAGSLKATLCRRGVGLLRQFCTEHELTYREIGKVVVALDATDVQRLRDIEHRAHVNGVPGVRWLDAAELHEIEPSVAGIAALHSPTAAIVDYRAVARAMAGDIQAAGGAIRLNAHVRTIRTGRRGRTAVAAGDQQHLFDRLIICAGLQTDLVARLAGDQRGPAIVPFRGEYYRLKSQRANLVRGLVYPVPDPTYPFLGMHFTPRVDGAVDIGPNAVLAMAREGYRRRDITVRDLVDIGTWSGARKLFRAHWRTGVHEVRGSLSKRAFVTAAQAYVPSLRPEDVVRAPAGVRAQAVDADGSLVDDFRITRLGPVTAIRNAPSPAATASLAIAEHLVEQLLE